MANDVVSKTVTGSIANFTTNLTRPLQALKTYFTPNQNGSGDPSPENVRDIVSWNSIDVIQCGKNIIGRSGLKASVTANDITATLRSDGTSYTLSGTATARADLYILTYANYAWQPMSYTISVNAGLAINDTGDYLIISIVDSENTIRYITTKSSKQFTIASNEKVRGIFIRVAEGKVLDNVVVTPQIEVGSTASSYEPYSSTTYPISFSPSDPSLVAGTLNITTGELTVTHKKLVIDGTNLDVSDILKINASSTYNSILYALDKDLFGNDTPKYTSGKAYPMFNWLAEMTTQTLEAIWHGYLSESNGISMVIPSGTASTEANLKSYLTAHPLEIGYELAEPQTYQLTPQEITALFGVNNIWTTANGGNEVTYLDKEHADIALSRRRIIMSAPHIESASGSIASFSTDMTANLKECKIAFSPVQSGSGDPSPSNVRPISGKTKVGVYSAKNSMFDLLDYDSSTVNGVTLSYLGNGEFEQDVQATSNTRFDISIDPFILEEGHKYYFITKCVSLYEKSTSTFAIGLRGNNVTEVSFIFRDNDQFGYLESVFNNENNVTIDTLRIQFSNGVYLDRFSIGLYDITQMSIVHDISWQSEAGTVYGGYVDLVKGEVVAEWANVDMGTLIWIKSSVTPQSGGSAFSTLLTNIGMMSRDARYTPNTMLSSAFATAPDDRWYIVNMLSDEMFSNATELFVSSSQYDTSASFTTAVSGVQLVYKLATPIHTPITPTILKTLKGTNNIWSSANGDADISYWTH